MNRQVVERCSGDHAHVAIQFVYQGRFAEMVITTNQHDTERAVCEAIENPHVTHILGMDHEVHLN